MILEFLSMAAFVAAGLAQGGDDPAQRVEQGSGRQVYDADFYRQFSPRTAWDMIGQTPGFTLEEGGERRGFAGAVGNVLIDGERPVAKSQTLADILRRIPASQVVRIELLRGGETAGDASGQAVLANIVRAKSTGQGVWSLGAEHAGRSPAPNGWVSWSGHAGETDYTLGAAGYSFERNLPGERQVSDGSGMPTATKRDFSPREFGEISINGEASRAALGGKIRLTGQAYRSRYHEDSRIETYSPPGVQTDEEVNPYTEVTTTYEGGAHYERAIGPWTAKLSGLLTRKRFESGVTSTHRDETGVADSVFTQDLVRDSGESILRATGSRTLGEGQTLEAGLEGAFNMLEQTQALTLDLGGGPFAIPVPNANLRVEETRADAFIAHGWQLTERWTLESRLAWEGSELVFTGDSDQITELQYFKPSVQLSRRLGQGGQFRAKLYRDVGQLDFEDFVSVVSLSDDVIEGGNPDLVPETSWRAELATDLKFGKEGAFGITLFQHWVEDTVDLVPVGEAGSQIDAPGNIGDAVIRGVDITFRAPLRPVIPGGSLTVDATAQSSDVTDPLTGEERTVSGFEETALKAEFRQDLAARKFAWGAEYTHQPEKSLYKVVEIDLRRKSPSLDFWVETTAVKGLTARLTALSVLDQPEERTRTFHVPDRTGVIWQIEDGERHPGHWLLFTVSGSL